LDRSGARGCEDPCINREYNVFLNAFPNERRLSLQDLTRGDIERYVRDKLNGPGDENLNDIVRVITDKDNGIFLWVALVPRWRRASLIVGAVACE